MASQDRTDWCEFGMICMLTSVVESLSIRRRCMPLVVIMKACNDSHIEEETVIRRNHESILHESLTCGPRGKSK